MSFIAVREDICWVPHNIMLGVGRVSTSHFGSAVIIHNPKEQCNTRSIEVAQLDHEIHTALALPELDADAIIDKILRRAELQFNYCAAGDDDPTTMQIKRACKEFKPTDTFPESFYSSIVSKIILHLDTHIDIKLRNGQTL